MKYQGDGLSDHPSAEQRAHPPQPRGVASRAECRHVGITVRNIGAAQGCQQPTRVSSRTELPTANHARGVSMSTVPELSVGGLFLELSRSKLLGEYWPRLHGC